RETVRLVGVQRAVPLVIRRPGHRLEFGEGVPARSTGRSDEAPGLASLHGGHRRGAGLSPGRAPGPAPAAAGGKVEVRHRADPGGRAGSRVRRVPAAVWPQADAVLRSGGGGAVVWWLFGGGRSGGVAVA